MVQLGCIEINPWNSKVSHLDNPDWIVIDLDPEGVGFDKVIKTALVVRRVCNELGISSHPKTSGKTGLHIYIPTNAKYSYKLVRQFAGQLAETIHQQAEDFTSIERSPEKRRGKVYIDFLQNSQGQTLAAPYSVRPTKEATVSTPLHWDEVEKGLDPKKLTMKDIQSRLDKMGDLWQPILEAGVDLSKILKKLD